ncbi:MAG TPA: MarR family transcriptional regulator [Hyphomicrobiaceae bacterium]|nr:MarR family transcriptional regulator [Hyphomicrobiaceae bacterium]
MPSLPDDEHYIGYVIADVGRLLRTVFERRIRPFGLTRAQWIVIARLFRRPGLNQSEIADLLEIEKATAGRLIDRMEVKGWIERRADKADRRMHRLHLTAKARRLHAQIWPIAEATVDDAFRNLSAAERAATGRALVSIKSRLVDLLDDDPAFAGGKSRTPAARPDARAPNR